MEQEKYIEEDGKNVAAISNFPRLMSFSKEPRAHFDIHKESARHLEFLRLQTCICIVLDGFRSIKIVLPRATLRSTQYCDPAQIVYKAAASQANCIEDNLQNITEGAYFK